MHAGCVARGVANYISLFPRVGTSGDIQLSGHFIAENHCILKREGSKNKAIIMYYCYRPYLQLSALFVIVASLFPKLLNPLISPNRCGHPHP